jgi:hypothetical protein
MPATAKALSLPHDQLHPMESPLTGINGAVIVLSAMEGPN